ncbi:MAG: hypothetical protein J6Y08_02550 [Clostridiales bacterium]|nr:hypothetical protein [Clostridiales bacterium]
MIQCERGHFYDENRNSSCPYCNQISSRPRAVTPPVAPPNMEIPKPSCGKTVAIEGMETEPQISKTVAIENFEENVTPINKTVAISESQPAPFSTDAPSGLPSMASAPAAPVAPVVPAVAEVPVMPVEPVAPVMPVETAVPEAPAVPEIPAVPEVEVPQVEPVSSFIPQAPVETSAIPQEEVHPDVSAEIPYNGVSEEPERVLTEQIEIDTYPYGVTGLGVTENPKPIPNDIGATFPVPNEGGDASTSAQPGQAEAAAFAAFGFPGGPMPGMMPGGPMPMPMAGGPAPMPGGPLPISPDPIPAPPPIDLDPKPVVAETFPVETPVEAPAESPAEETVSSVPGVAVPLDETETRNFLQDEARIEAENILDPEARGQKQSGDILTPPPVSPFVPAPPPILDVPEDYKPEPKPADPNATVAMTESDMDYIPRMHARAFLVCIDGPMTGASFVFSETSAVIGRQKNYEIALHRDITVSRSPHANLKYDKDRMIYSIAPASSDKKVSVNGIFINQEYNLNLYDVIGIGQTRLLFIPVCSEKFSW